MQKNLSANVETTDVSSRLIARPRRHSQEETSSKDFYDYYVPRRRNVEGTANFFDDIIHYL